MKKSICIVIAIIAVVGIFLIGQYNGMVTLDENVNTAYSNLDTQLQRRADLIPNLVSTVKGYVKHEEEAISSVTKARENLAGASDISDKAKANDELSKAINNLFVIVENYPDLKASANFVSLQDEIAGTENRIATARKDYNDAVNAINSKVKMFPSNVLAGMFGIEKRSYFEASEGSAETPNVSFE